ncbi:MAG: hypothetical protein JXA78_17045 [Anaerolineales bacterium]|nr:hypothetical protein [Anaerolineales bacterium]
MNTTRHRLVISLLILFVTSACLSFFGQDRRAVEAEHTQAASTVLAQFTQSAGETAVAQLTQRAIPAKETLPPSTPSPYPLPSQPPTPAPTDTLAPSPTVLPSPTNTALPCDLAQFVQDINVPSGSVFPAGARFTKTWRVQNVGACDWMPEYALVFAGGEMMGGISAFYLPRTVRPGETVDISATLNAPPYPGSYLGNWLLQNASGELFGVDGEAPLQVQINVIQSGSALGYKYDFAANYCTAEWSSQAAALNCPGSAPSPDGSVVLVNSPDLEGRRSSGYGLWTRPNERADGFVRGYYPYLLVDLNDHFLAEIGCFASSPGCNLIFQLDYLAADGASGNLGRWRESYDGSTTPLDVDLSGLARQRVRLVLTALNNGDPASAGAIWLLPRIQNVGSQYSLALTWSREGFPNPSSCNQLDIYLIGDLSGEARAFSCSQGKRELGRISLPAEDVSRLLAWRRQLENFDSQIYRASAEQPVVSWLYFYGLGSSTAQDSNIQAMHNYATRLFEQIVGSRLIE